MSKKNGAKRLLLSLYHYVCFFLLMAFLITCCMLLFLSTMSKTMGIEINGANVRSAALLTFGNVVFLSLLCTVIDALRRRIMVDRPVRKIVRAAEQIAKGNYSVRIEPLGSFNRADGLDEVAECFNKMAEELSGVQTLQSDFIANVSHELKTPLTVMQNYGTLLQDPTLTREEQIRYAKAVTDACRRLSDLVTNILRLSKLENQQIYPHVQEYDLSEQLCECMLSFEQVWEKKGIDIRAELSQPVTVCADPELLSLVWNNLLSNAFKFTGEGGIVRVSLSVQEEWVCVAVSDNGCGISPEVGRHIFDKFYQGDPSHATGGNGLGLALVKRVVDIVGGEIGVESTPGSGTVFTVKIRR